MPCAKPTWINSIGLKVLLAYIAGVVLSIVLMLAVLTLMTKQSDYLVSTDVAERAYELAEMLQFDRAGMPIGFDNSEGDRDWMYESLKQEIAYRVLDAAGTVDRKSTRLNSSHVEISYAVFCLKKKKNKKIQFIETTQ